MNWSWSSRNCARCRRQNGQANPRKNTSTTGPFASSSSSEMFVPRLLGSANRGAGVPTAAVVLCVDTPVTLRHVASIGPRSH